MNYLIAVIVVLIIGIVLSICLAVADKFFKVEDSESKQDIENMLPGINCGVCGFPGCAGLAEAMADKKIKSASKCKVLNKEKRENLQKYLDEME